MSQRAYEESSFAVVVFHNEARTDFQVRGPFKSYELAYRGYEELRDKMPALREAVPTTKVEIVQMVTVDVR